MSVGPPLFCCCNSPRAAKREMVRGSLALMRDAAINGLNRTLSEILVCPLSKQPLRICDKTGSLISDEIGVSFPIKDGIPCLVPKDGKILEDNDNDAALKSGLVDDSSSTNMVSKTR